MCCLQGGFVPKRQKKKKEKLCFIPVGKAELLQGAEDPACGALGGLLLNQQIGNLKSASEIHSGQEGTKNFLFSCIKIPPNPNEATTSLPMEYSNSFVETCARSSELLGHPSLESTGDARGQQLRPCLESKTPPAFLQGFGWKSFFSPQIPREIKSFLFPLLDNSCSLLFGPCLNYSVCSSRWHLLRALQCSR